MTQDEQHIYHHAVEPEPKFNFKLERNSRGTNVEVTVIGARSVGEGIALLNEAVTKIKAELASFDE